MPCEVVGNDHTDSISMAEKGILNRPALVVIAKAPLEPGVLQLGLLVEPELDVRTEPVDRCLVEEPGARARDRQVDRVDLLLVRGARRIDHRHVVPRDSSDLNRTK